MITDRKFVEVLKGLTDGDFSEAKDVIDKLTEKFNCRELRSHFTEEEFNRFTGFVERYDEDLLTTVLVTRFKEK